MGKPIVITDTLQALIYQTCLDAAVTLGDDIKGLSCFLNNWGDGGSEIIEGWGGLTFKGWKG